MERVKHGGEDWRKRLRRATFRGAFFWVESDGIDGGRRIVVHEFPLSELPYNEDMGQQARRFELEAYVVGGQADKQAKKLIEACTAPGPATLVMPLFGSIRARCVAIRTNREKDKQGYVSFRLKFVADDLSLSALSGSPHIKSQVRTKSRGQLPPALRAAFEKTFFGADVPEFVFDSAVLTARQWLIDFDLMLTASELRGERVSSLLEQSSLLYDNMDKLLDVGFVGDIYGRTSFVTNEMGATAEPFASGITNLLVTYTDIAQADIAVTGLLELYEFGGNLQPIPLTTLNRKQEKKNQESLLEFFHRSTLSQLAIAVTEATYPSRREAVDARAHMAELFSNELNLTNDPAQWEVIQELRNLQGLTIEFLSKLIADLSPVMQIEAQTRMPSTYWAYRLYGDANRDEELWLRNEIKHPMWMPVEFEALVR